MLKGKGTHWLLLPRGSGPHHRTVSLQQVLPNLSLFTEPFS